MPQETRSTAHAAMACWGRVYLEDNCGRLLSEQSLTQARATTPKNPKPNIPKPENPKSLYPIRPKP